MQDVIIHDSTAPTVTLNSFSYISQATASAVVIAGGAVAGSANCSSGTFAASLDYSGVTDGSVAITADLSDMAGNSATQASVP